MYRIVDTNVLVIANGINAAPQSSLTCVLSCVQFLNNLKKSDILVLDLGRLILNEYKRNVSEKGQPGVGDAFLKWVLTNQTNPKHCEQVSITQISEFQFEEFPTSESLLKFDKSDRKFVAVALTHHAKPAIANATDRGWRKYKNALEEHGVKLDFLCSELSIKI